MIGDAKAEAWFLCGHNFVTMRKVKLSVYKAAVRHGTNVISSYYVV